MKVVKPSDFAHSISLIPRTYEVVENFYLTNETTKETQNLTFNYLEDNGIVNVFFIFTFKEFEKYEFKLTDVNNKVIFRGKIFATEQETQNYDLTKDLYFYE